MRKKNKIYEYDYCIDPCIVCGDYPLFYKIKVYLDSNYLPYHEIDFYCDHCIEMKNGKVVKKEIK